MLEVNNLKIAYNTKASIEPAVIGLNLSLKSGTLAMLAGRNGSGKSSLLRVLAGLQLPQTGEVIINGQSLAGLRNADISALVSIMFSIPPLLELTTVQEVVLTAMQRHFSPLKLNFTEEWKEINRCLQLCGMESFANRVFDSLSDGEKQKVMLARSLAQNTPLLLLDEPMAFLDYPSRKELLDLLNKLAHQEQKTILFSSHDLDIALMNCDSFVLLQGNGKWKTETDLAVIKTLSPMDLF
jgi:iron complex transport system ATP-binding protein